MTGFIDYELFRFSWVSQENFWNWIKKETTSDIYWNSRFSMHYHVTLCCWTNAVHV